MIKKLILNATYIVLHTQKEIAPETKHPPTTYKIMSEKIAQKYPNTQEDAPDSSCKDLCLILGGGCTMLGLFVAWICWIIYSIIALANNSNDDIRDICSDSNLWACLLTIVILSLIQVVSGKSSASKEEGEPPIAACCSLVISIGFFIWEAIELFNPCALNSRPTSVYIMLLIHFCFVAVVLSLLIIAGIVYCCAVACCMNKENEDGSTWVNGNALPYHSPQKETKVSDLDSAANVDGSTNV